MTPRTPIWKAIATSLRNDVAEGVYSQGDKLPTEAVLATRFG
ncbi:MAG: GntR family transcriptional regulator, partial [Loktanella sp.]|nr:GntR family transcriptional regulator [Loktanella sp.]